MNKQDNLPQVKTVEGYNESPENAAGLLADIDIFRVLKLPNEAINRIDLFVSSHTVPLQFRIAELERNEMSDAKHIASLERQVKWYEKIVDKHIISTANYTSEYIDKVISERDKYREALEEAALQIEYLHGKFKETGSGNSVLARIEQALNSKEVGA